MSESCRELVQRLRPHLPKAWSERDGRRLLDLALLAVEAGEARQAVFAPGVAKQVSAAERVRLNDTADALMRHVMEANA